MSFRKAEHLMTSARDDYPELAAVADRIGGPVGPVEARRALDEIDRWRQADAAEEKLYDVMTEDD